MFRLENLLQLFVIKEVVVFLNFGKKAPEDVGLDIVFLFDSQLMPIGQSHMILIKSAEIFLMQLFIIHELLDKLSLHMGPLF